MIYQLVKRVPTKDYEARYDVSDSLMLNIAGESNAAYAKRDPISAIDLAMMLARGETFYIGSPFSEDPREVEWTIEAETARTYKQDCDWLTEGTGELWEVRVINGLDENDYVELHVRGETDKLAANKAEQHARRYPDMYFGVPEPHYYADRHNIYRLDEDEGEVVVNDDPDIFPGYDERD